MYGGSYTLSLVRQNIWRALDCDLVKNLQDNIWRALDCDLVKKSASGKSEGTCQRLCDLEWCALDCDLSEDKIYGVYRKHQHQYAWYAHASPDHVQC